MATLPTSLALTSIADGALAVAADHRNNFAAVQAEANALLTILGAGATNQVLTSGGGTTVAWGPAYTDYTPTWSASGVAPVLNNGTLTARYMQIGKTVHYFGVLTMGTTTTFGTGTYSLSLPINRSAVGNFYGRAHGIIELFDSSAGSEIIGWADTQASVSQFRPMCTATYAGAPTQAATTVPWTWATSDFIAWNITYEGV